MKRRSFLRLLGMTAVAAAVPLPCGAESAPDPRALFIPEGPTACHIGVRGVPYILNNTGDYFGVRTLTVMKAPSDLVSGAILTPEMLDRMKVLINAKECYTRARG